MHAGQHCPTCSSTQCIDDEGDARPCTQMAMSVKVVAFLVLSMAATALAYRRRDEAMAKRRALIVEVRVIVEV